VTGDGEASGGADAAQSSGRERTDRRAGHVGSDVWLYGWALGYAAVEAASLLVPLYAIDPPWTVLAVDGVRREKAA
jgi:hypothetical protein